jgi:hypothetical protein
MKLRPVTRVGLAGAAIATVLLALAAPAFAHEQRRVGAYQFTVGWQHEPAYAGTENGVQVFVRDANGTPIDELGTPVTLKVQAIYGGQASPYLALEPSWDPDTGLGTHGEWDAAITPTQSGNYTFHFTGTIHGQPIDQRFTSSDSTFATVEDPTAVEFPTKTPPPVQLAAGVARLQPRVEALAASASSAEDKASTATTVAIVAVALAVVLGGVAIGLALSGRKARSAS